VKERGRNSFAADIEKLQTQGDWGETRKDPKGRRREFMKGIRDGAADPKNPRWRRSPRRWRVDISASIDLGGEKRKAGKGREISCRHESGLDGNGRGGKKLSCPVGVDRFQVGGKLKYTRKSSETAKTRGGVAGRQSCSDGNWERLHVEGDWRKWGGKPTEKELWVSWIGFARNQSKAGRIGEDPNQKRGKSENGMYTNTNDWGEPRKEK